MLFNKFRILGSFRKCKVLKAFTYELNQVEMQSSGHKYRSMADHESVAASSEDGTLPGTFNLVAKVPNLTVWEYCTLYGRLLDARRFA